MEKKNSIMRLMAVIAIAFFSTIYVTAQSVRYHVVKEGETLTSIAKKYSVKKSDIVSMNPDAAKEIFAGMELQIPSGKSLIYSDEIDIKDNAVDNVVNKTDNNGEWDMSYEIGYGFLPKEEGLNGSSYEYRATIGANYILPYGLYAGVRIGYNSSNYYSYVYANKTSCSSDIKCHLLCIPIEIGYRFLFDSNKEIGFSPFAGIDFNIGLSGKQKIKLNKEETSEDLEIGGKIGVGGRVGLRLLLWGFNLSGSYVFPFNDKQKQFFGEKSYPELTIGFGL